MVNESMPWHNQVEEGERNWDREMAPNQLYLYSSLLVGIPIVNDVKAYSISPLLTRDWL